MNVSRGRQPPGQPTDQPGRQTCEQNDSGSSPEAPLTERQAEPQHTEPQLTEIQGAGSKRGESAAQRVVIAIGLPGAGKSTWFRKRSIEPISSDGLRVLIADDVDAQGHQDDIFRAVRFLLELRLRMGRPATYIDATNLLASHRRDFIEIGRRHDCRLEALFFDVPLEVCLKRNAGRNRRVPEDVMRVMAQAMDRPTLEEGFDQITIVGPDGEAVES